MSVSPENPFEALLSDGTAGPGLAGTVGSLARAGLTVATAESLTGGLLAAALTSVPGSSAVVRGGLVVYATDLKHVLAGVDANLLDRVGPVHPEVAAALAEGARRRCSAAVGVGLTGVAGPDPQNGRPAGTWFVAAAGPAGLLTADATTPNGTAADVTAPAFVDGPPTLTRHRVRVAAVLAALGLLRQHAAATPGPNR